MKDHEFLLLLTRKQVKEFRNSIIVTVFQYLGLYVFAMVACYITESEWFWYVWFTIFMSFFFGRSLKRSLKLYSILKGPLLDIERFYDHEETGTGSLTLNAIPLLYDKGTSPVDLDNYPKHIELDVFDEEKEKETD